MPDLFESKRTEEEVRELIEECRFNKLNNVPLSFEHGIRSVLAWLYYETAPYPYDASIPDISKVIVDPGTDYKIGES
jgi:hypothetical protein